MLSFETIFDESYERAMLGRDQSTDFFHAFYEEFTGMSEEIAQHFANTDMARQRAMLKKSFYSLLTFYASGNADQYLERIAREHGRSKLAIRPALYDHWLEALIKTVRAFDGQFNSRIELAWRLVMAPGIVYMKFHYDNSLE